MSLAASGQHDGSVYHAVIFNLSLFLRILFANSKMNISQESVTCRRFYVSFQRSNSEIVRAILEAPARDNKALRLAALMKRDGRSSLAV